jgi:hypothetical protein
MLHPNSCVYLETSAVNFLADNRDRFSPAETKAYHALKGTSFLASPVTIWEILLTNDEIRREALIYFFQNLASRQLLKSPAELILEYMAAECPLVEKKFSLQSQLHLAGVWADIVDNSQKSLRFEEDHLQAQMSALRKGFALASKMIEDVGITDQVLTPIQGAQFSLEQTLRQMKTISYEHMTELNRRQYKISIILILFIICVGAGLEEHVLENYWKGLGIDSTAARFYYLFQNYETLIYRGPFAVMSQMVLTQLNAGAKPTRGIFWDALHSVYLVYCDYFLSTDNHFKLLRESSDHLNFQKIVILSDQNLYPAKGVNYLKIG